MSIDGWKFDSNSNGNEFLRVKPDCRLKVRLIGKPLKVVKIFDNKKQCCVLENEEVGKMLKAKYSHRCSGVCTRYMCWCIDRDDNTMKILDMPLSVVRAIGRRQALVEKPISGIAEGCDWKIVTNGKKNKEVRYEAVYLIESPLTEAEQQMLKDKSQANPAKFDLSKMFKCLSFLEAEQKLFV